jgi:hypothetical protein
MTLTEMKKEMIEKLTKGDRADYLVRMVEHVPDNELSQELGKLSTDELRKLVAGLAGRITVLEK